MAANEWSHDASIARLTTVAEEYNFFQAARLLDGALAARAYVDGLDKIRLERLRVIAPKLNR